MPVPSHFLTSKVSLRKWAKVQVPTSILDQKLRSAQVVSQIRTSPIFASSKHTALFMPLPNEVDLLELVMGQWEKFLFPRVDPSSFAMDFYQVRGLSDFEQGYKGILEPRMSCPKKRDWNPEDLILIPGLLFDTKGNRLGKGAGFYDRYIGQIQPKAHLWGVCWQDQRIDSPLPCQKHDMKVQAVCCESGVFFVES